MAFERTHFASTGPHPLTLAFDRLHIVADAAGIDSCIDALLLSAHDRVVVVDFFNQHAANLLTRDRQFRENFLASDWLLRDGIGSKIALKLSGYASGCNMNGTDLIPQIVARFADRYRRDFRSDGGDRSAMICFGTREPWLTAGAKVLTANYDGPLLMRDGYAADADYVAMVERYAEHRKLIVLAMGMPRQEALAQVLKRSDIGPTLILCGGAVIDFAAGRFARAPRWMRATGLEWLFRLLIEPRRLFRRYVLGIPIFLLAAARAAAQRNRH